MVAGRPGRIERGIAMCARLIRLLAVSAVLAALCGASTAFASVSPVRVSGIPRTVVKSPSLSFSLDLQNTGRTARPTLSAWLSAPRRLTPLRRITPRIPPIAADRQTTLALTSAVPASQRAGTYTVIVCAARHKLRTPGAKNCLHSGRFSLTEAIAVTPGSQPTRVTTTLDPSRAVSATIGTAGGTLATTTADGSALVLTIPPNALAGDERVTLSPLLKLSGAGLSLVTGAQLGPDGLRLLAPAQLTITPARSVSPSQQVAFGYQGSGTQFGLVPLALGAGVQVPVLRLGGVGLGQANGGQLAGRIARPPSDSRAAWLQQLAAAMRIRRLQRLHLNPRAPQNPVTQARAVLGGYYNRYVEPPLNAAGSSVGAFETAEHTTIGWERELQLLGFSPTFGPQQERHAAALLDAALLKVWVATLEGCDGSDTVEQLQAVLTVGRVAQTLGIDSIIGGDGAVQSAIQGCAQIPVTASLTVPNANWQSGSSANRVAQDTVAVTINGVLQFVQPAGGNEFALASPQEPVSEQILSATESANASAAGCQAPVFVSFATDPTQMYASFTGRLTLPADLFDAGAPGWTLDVGVAGADMASWTISCPPSMTPVPFDQAPGVMAGLAAITGATPIRLTSSKLSRAFQGGIDVLDGSTITGFVNARGTASINVP
jgi:hypothetical protein